MKPDQFRAWRKRLGLTQSVVAGLLGKTLRTVQYWEAGTINIPKSIDLAVEAITTSHYKKATRCRTK